MHVSNSPPFPVNLVVEVSAEISTLGSESCAGFPKDSSTQKSLHLRTLTFDLFCAHLVTHGFAMVFRIGSGSGINDWVTHRSRIVPFSCSVYAFLSDNMPDPVDIS